MGSYTVKENYIGTVVSEILRYRQKHLTTLYYRTSGCVPSIYGFYIQRNKEGQKKNLNQYKHFLIKIKWPKTIPGPIRSFTVKENHIGSVVSEILHYR